VRVFRLPLLALALLLALAALLPLEPAPAFAQPSCSFNLGFKALRDQIPQIVGDCLENERFNPANGNAEQRTTGGLLVWRKADNWTAFTNGSLTWVNGPFGLQSRPNGSRFEWEAGPPGQPVVRAPAAPAAPPAPPSAAGRSRSEQAASATRSGWATVVGVAGPSVVLAESASGERLRVWHLGIIGPTEDQGDWAAQSTEVHRQLLARGARVWLEAEAGREAPFDGLVLRHVLRDGDPARPVAGELLRAGTVWVFPHLQHAYVEAYADRQAEAVRARAGAWGLTGSSAVFLPRGEQHGGYPINPRVLAALQVLDRTETGHALLSSVNRFPVEIGVAPTGPGEIAHFIPRFYTIQLSESVMSSSPESLAAALVHELTHTRQMLDELIDGQEFDCYEAEIEAFNRTAEFWQALYGLGGKVPARGTRLDGLEAELNETLEQYQRGFIAERVRRSYVHQCSARTG
jgi:hypothetical protein